MEALNWYLNEGSYEVNSFLRDGSLPRGGTAENAKRQAKILDDLISIQDPLEDDTVVYHGGPDLDLSEGDEFSDRGFTSNTDDEAIADAFAMAYLIRDKIPGQTYTVTMPKGSRALSVWAVDPSIDNESEWIMPPGSTFRVTGDNELRVT